MVILASSSIPTLLPNHFRALSPAVSHHIPIPFSGTGTEGNTIIKQRRSPDFKPSAAIRFASVPGQSFVIDYRYSKLSSSTGLRPSAGPPKHKPNQAKPSQVRPRESEQLPSRWGKLCAACPIVV